ncbi:L2 [Macaca mulatta papillomavirus 3]|uniref:Minor capsid protein L2 n=1 Tax=Macaca mulatta papillomavirus 3 TaxID=2294151 RepID=A0A385AH79_9PAPI|nr:L2 [Macaca mulatta papillomavirus 3]AXN57292.1 L2 [Macaca mulatta papillomavirus 3]
MTATRAKRRKRASATQLYQTCKAAGTCPPDVVPKVEGTTVADRILQWGSLGVFLGGLGIGTGSGSGGRTGYIPIGSRPGTAIDIAPTRPPVIIEPVAPSDPSIVTLLEDSSIVNSGVATPNFTGTAGFEVTSSATTTPAVLDITPVSGTVQISSTSFTNPLFTEPSLVEPPQVGETSGRVLISTPTSGTHSFEEIPMHTFAVHGTGNEPISSTPIPGVRRLAGPRLYSRAYQQVRVTDPAFLSRPGSLISYDNPAYDPEETLTFANTSGRVAPDPDFLDIVSLHRPALTATRRGTVRFSRLGHKATLRTRSGKQIGARVHYYHDLSPIAAAAESIELQPLVPTEQEPLYDIYADLPEGPRTGSAAPRLTTSTLSTSLSSPYGNTTVPLPAAVDVPVHAGPDVHSQSAPVHPQGPYSPVNPLDTTHAVVVQGSDYYLWPGYFLFPKKRKRMLYSFADGIVAA